MINYAIAENNGRWIKVNAKTLAAAKRAASLKQTYQGTDLYVGVFRDAASVYVVAKKLHRNALNMRATAGWQDVN